MCLEAGMETWSTQARKSAERSDPSKDLEENTNRPPRIRITNLAFEGPGPEMGQENYSEQGFAKQIWPSPRMRKSNSVAPRPRAFLSKASLEKLTRPQNTCKEIWPLERPGLGKSQGNCFERRYLWSGISIIISDLIIRFISNPNLILKLISGIRLDPT